MVDLKIKGQQSGSFDYLDKELVGFDVSNKKKIYLQNLFQKRQRQLQNMSHLLIDSEKYKDKGKKGH